MTRSADRAQAVVALGGGHGLHASLSALRLLVDDLTVDDLTAIVTVADNGGSSGRLRGEFNVLPPGDLRMALAALCGDDAWGDTWARVLQHRFAGEGEMRDHVVGNLLIVGLWELLGDHVDALDLVGRLLGAKGRVLPMALTPMDITAEVRGLAADPDELTTVRGQVEVATTDGVIVSIDLEPPDPPVSADALAKLAEADWVFLGPGSWFSSVLPHLRVPALRQAVVSTARPPGRRAQPGGAGRGDRWLRPGRPPLRAARARARPLAAHRARRSDAAWTPSTSRSSQEMVARRPAPSSCSPTSRSTTGARATTRASWPPPTPGSSRAGRG